MNIEAFLIIGGFCVVLGMILLIPSLWIAKRKTSNKPEKHPAIRLTKVGWIFLVVFLSVLFIGSGAQYLFPGTLAAEYITGFWGISIWMIFNLVLSSALEKLLIKLGYPIIVKNKSV